jgi:hypothetical protein
MISLSQESHTFLIKFLQFHGLISMEVFIMYLESSVFVYVCKSLSLSKKEA